MNQDKKALLKIIAAELHKPVIRKFPRRKVVVMYPNETWAADLVDMSAVASENKGFKYMLNVIDIYSRYAWIEPMKNKSADDTLNAIKAIVKKANATPVNLWVDEGKEFYNTKVKAYCKQNNITLYSTFGPHKSAIIERFNRTIKEKIYRQFTEDDEDKWIDKVQLALKDYNKTKHKTTQEKPTDRIKDEKDEALQETNLFELPNEKKPKFQVGDRVRTTLVKKVFDKGYKRKWSDEIYTVKKVIKSHPITYILEDALGEELKGKMYEQELQKTKQGGLGELYVIEKILETKTVRGQKQSLVKWKGFPDKFNSWVLTSSIVQ